MQRLSCCERVDSENIISYINSASHKKVKMGFSNKHNTWLGVLFVLVLSSGAFAQNNSFADITVNATLIKGLNINLVNGDLDFGDIIQSGVSTKVIRTPDKGIYLELNGHPGHDVFVNYNTASLSNKPWSDTYGGTEGNLLFLPDVEYSNTEPDFSIANHVIEGNSYSLSNSADPGKLHIWIGGEIDIPRNQPSGDYSGQFVITVSY